MEVGSSRKRFQPWDIQLLTKYRHRFDNEWWLAFWLEQRKKSDCCWDQLDWRLGTVHQNCYHQRGIGSIVSLKLCKPPKCWLDRLDIRHRQSLNIDRRLDRFYHLSNPCRNNLFANCRIREARRRKNGGQFCSTWTSQVSTPNSRSKTSQIAIVTAVGESSIEHVDCVAESLRKVEWKILSVKRQIRKEELLSQIYLLTVGSIALSTPKVVCNEELFPVELPVLTESTFTLGTWENWRDPSEPILQPWVSWQTDCIDGRAVSQLFPSLRASSGEILSVLK